MLMGNEPGYYLAHRFGAQLALLVPGQFSFLSLDAALGQPHYSSFMVGMDYQFRHPLTFVQRATNAIAAWGMHYFLRNYLILSSTEALLDKHFPGEPRPDLLELERNASLGLSLGHPLLLSEVRPTQPNFVHIGMIGCREAQPLPQDLEEFMASGEEHGVIYFSLGSILLSSNMTPELQAMFLNVFSRLKQRVLWKWESEDMEGKPDNVKLVKWLPQQDILGHQNTKLYLTHSGLSSMQETLCHKVPVVSLPVCNDQGSNAAESVRLGIGKMIDFKDATEESLFEAITEVLANPKYKQKAEEIGAHLLDQETPPLARAVWWLEYIARHPGQHYRSPAHDLTWIQLHSIDVMATLATVLLVALKLFAFVLKRFFAKVKNEDSSKKTN